MSKKEEPWGRDWNWRQWASDAHARVVVSKLHDVTNMQMKKTRAPFSRVSFGEIFCAS